MPCPCYEHLSTPPCMSALLSTPNPPTPAPAPALLQASPSWWVRRTQEATCTNFSSQRQPRASLSSSHKWTGLGVGSRETRNIRHRQIMPNANLGPRKPSLLCLHHRHEHRRPPMYRAVRHITHLHPEDTRTANQPMVRILMAGCKYFCSWGSNPGP